MSGYRESPFNKKMKVEAVRSGNDPDRRGDRHCRCWCGFAFARVRISIGAESLVRKNLSRWVSLTGEKITAVGDTDVGLWEFENAIKSIAWEFLYRVVDSADCGILFDVNNSDVFSQNHSFDSCDNANDGLRHHVGRIEMAPDSTFRRYFLAAHGLPVLIKARVEDVSPRGHEVRWHACTLERNHRIPSFCEFRGEGGQSNENLPDSPFFLLR